MIKRNKSLNLASWMIGIGIVLFVWHNPYQPLVNYLFLPWIGTALIICGIAFVLISKNYRLELGEKKVWIPLLVIAVSIVMSGVFNGNLAAASSVAVMLFGLYLVSRTLGMRIFKIAPYVVIAESASIVIWGAFHSWVPNGGLISPTNYDIATGVIVFFTLMSPKKWQWWLATVGMVGLLFSGSAEAMVVGVAMWGWFVIKKVNWGYRLWIPAIATAVTVVVMIVSGIWTYAQAPNMYRLALLNDTWKEIPPSQKYWTNAEAVYMDLVNADGEFNRTALDNIFGQRITHFKISEIRPFGYGLNLTKFYYGIPHNIVLIIIEQIGIAAVLCWLWIAGIGIRRKESRYIWIAFVLLGVFDHFIWTQAAPWFWILAGVTLGLSNMNKEKELVNANS
jgi:hypothetical protein